MQRDRILRCRVKIGLSVLVLFLLVASSVLSTVVINKDGITWDETLDISAVYNETYDYIDFNGTVAGTTDYTVNFVVSQDVIGGTTYCIAKNMTDGNLQFFPGIYALDDACNWAFTQIENVHGENGGTVAIAPGYYDMNSTIYMGDNQGLVALAGVGNRMAYAGNVELMGRGDCVTPTGVMIQIDNTWGSGQQAVLKGLTLNTGYPGLTLLNMTNVFQGIIEDCHFGIRDYGSGKTDYCVMATSCLLTYFNKCTFFGSDVAGVYLQTRHSDPYCPCNANTFYMCHFGAQPTGILVADGTWTTAIDHCTLEGITGYAVNFGSDGDAYGGGVSGGSITNCHLEGGDILLHDSSYTIIDGNYFASSNIIMEYNGTSFPQHNRILNNVFHNTGNTSLQLIGDSMVVSNNHLYSSTSNSNYSINLTEGENFTATNNELSNITLNGSSTPDAYVVNNVVNDVLGYATDTVLHDNNGFISENYGTLTVSSGTSSEIVSHGCDVTPSFVMITPIENLSAVGGGVWWLNTVNSTSFTLSVNGSLSGDCDFYWWARYNP